MSAEPLSGTRTSTLARPSAARPPLPFPLRLTQTGLNALGRTVPPLAGRWALDLFCTPMRHPEPAREKELLRTAEAFTVPFQNAQLAAHAWGEGPAVLLVHGWSGRGAQLGAFVQPLVDAGHRVVAFDLPAHGRTPGRRLNGFDGRDAVLRMGEAVGPFQAVIAHSFGAVCTTLALKEGMVAGRVAYLAPACHLDQAVRGFARQLGLSWPVEWGLREEMERTFGPGVWAQVSGSVIARSFRLPALIVHDIEDAEVPWREGQSLAHAWPGARLITTSGLGHRRILRDEGVVREAVELVRA
ncbi:MAG TPA: alpha/beta fold hydrolase [Thermoanaerobaculia bacterium]|nr:alpha/beta fold hydrolase [Thermoanaerobaculia bacterium]